MQNIVVSKSLVAASANNIALSQSGTARVPLTLNGSTVTGGEAVLDTQRRILFTPAGNESTNTFTIVGRRQGPAGVGSGQLIREVVTGANTPTTFTSRLDYFEVISITPTNNTAAALTVGTSTIGSTAWRRSNSNVSPVEITFANVASGTVNATIEYTYDDYFIPPTGLNAVSLIPTAFPDTLLTAFTTSVVGQMNDPIVAWRLTINSGTGTVTTTAVQGGIGSP